MTDPTGDMRRAGLDVLTDLRDHSGDLGPPGRGTTACPDGGRAHRVRLTLRDDRCHRMQLPDTADGGELDAPDALLRLLVEARFAGQVARTVLTHRVVRMTRTRDGTTTLVQAARPRRHPGRRGGPPPSGAALAASPRVDIR